MIVKGNQKHLRRQLPARARHRAERGFLPRLALPIAAGSCRSTTRVTRRNTARSDPGRGVLAGKTTEETLTWAACAGERALSGRQSLAVPETGLT